MGTLLLSPRWTVRLQAQAPEEAPATGREKENDIEERRAGQQIADDYRLPWRTGQQDGDATGEARQQRSGCAEALRSCPVPSPPGPAPACSACSRSQAMQGKPPLLNKHLWANKKPKTGGRGWDWGCLILLGSAWQAADARLLGSVEGKKGLNDAQGSLLFYSISLSQWDACFLSQRNCKAKGQIQKTWAL